MSLKPLRKHGTDTRLVQKPAREFAQAELSGHRYVMVLHEHQTNPDVHLSVRAESRTGKRLTPRKTDLHRWRETFAADQRCGEDRPALLGHALRSPAGAAAQAVDFLSGTLLGVYHSANLPRCLDRLADSCTRSAD